VLSVAGFCDLLSWFLAQRWFISEQKVAERPEETPGCEGVFRSEINVRGAFVRHGISTLSTL